MEQQERLTKMKAAVIDFTAAAHQIPHLVSIVLFGSILERDVNKKSDIDLLLIFDTPENPETGEELKTAITIGGKITQKNQLENSFGFITVNLQKEEGTDPEFLEKVGREGVTIWTKGIKLLPTTISSLRPKVLLVYTTSNLNAKQRVTLHRKLYGYKTTTRQKGKEYKVESVGVVGKYGQKIGSNAVLIDFKNAPKVEAILKEFNLALKRYSLWE